MTALNTKAHDALIADSPKSFFQGLLNNKSRSLVFLAIVLFALSTRLYRLDFPKDFYFDEIYHGFTAAAYLHNDKRAYDPWAKPPENRAFEWSHPPLSKLLMAGMMAVFGEDSFGWRVGSAVFGTLAIIATGILAFELFGSLDLALTAMALLSLENLFLTQSRIAMNDSYLVLFVLLTFICYLRWRKRPASLKYLLLTGLCLGLALATKWTTLYLFIIIAIDLMAKVFFALPIAVWLGETIRLNLWKALKRFDHHHELPNYPFKQHQQTFQLGLIQAIFTEVRPLAFLALGLIPVLVYLASYSQYFLMGYDWSQFVELQKQMWWYHSGLKATHPYQSTPWQWIFDLRPVYMHIDASKPNETAFIYNLGNAVVLYAGLIAVLSQLRRLLCEKSEQNEQIRFLLLAYFMLWVPWLISPRIMLFYHYLPAVPLLCIILARWLDKLRGSQKPMSWWIRGFILGAAALWFIVFYPHNTGLFLKKDLMDSVYFALDSWR